MVNKIKLKRVSISFKNSFKQLPVPFKIYADSECIAHTQKNINIVISHIPCSFAYKVVCVDNKFSKKSCS